jgi:hypothetical protein
LALLIAAVTALLAFAVATPAQAGYYYDADYGSSCGYRCGGYRYQSCCGYRYRPCGDYGCGYRYHSCSSCGYHHRSYVYERRYVEREYVERSYGSPHYRHYGYYNDPYRPYRRYSYYGRPFPYGYGGVRDEPAPYDYERVGVEY